MAEPRFKPGDKVRIISSPNLPKDTPAVYKDLFKIGNVLTISNDCDCYGGAQRYGIEESSYFVVYEDEIELYDPDSMTVSVKLPLNDKKMAHRIVNNLVDSTYYAEKLRKEKAEKENRRWTPEEIQKAHDICFDTVLDIMERGGSVQWLTVFFNDNMILCRVTESDMRHTREGRSAPHHADEYNVWIGKCVSLCKALGKPIPDFILNKNMED